MNPILAHQGGWDELALFGAAGLVAIVAMRWGERRARKRAAAEEPAEAPRSELPEHRPGE